MREPFTRRAALRAAGAAGLAGLTATAGCAAAPAGTPTETPAGSATPTGTDAGSTGVAGDTGAPGVTKTDTIGMGCYADEDDYFFRPDLIRVEPGATVSFGVASVCRQQSLAYHPDNDAPLRMPEGADPWSSPVLQGSMGGTFEVTFEREGVYDYFGLHEDLGQVGSVIVGTPDPEDEPGLAPPQASIPEAARGRLADLNGRTVSYLSDRGI